ncbi:MAG: DUF4442 domain-containing protein [Bdellovibrionales bacterium]|nr:DUF4442 domain-containing protein [Bdellovibrionales bacterium]
MTNARLFRHLINLWPCIRGTGVRATHISDDYREIDLELPLNWRTRNRVGTIFGGSIYASTDPFYMIMLMEILGKDFVVWDKGATLKFKRPGTRTLFMKLRLAKEFTDGVRTRALAEGELTFELPVSYRDEDGVECAEVTKVLYVATKEFYRAKVARRDQAEKAKNSPESAR